MGLQVDGLPQERSIAGRTDGLTWTTWRVRLNHFQVDASRKASLASANVATDPPHRTLARKLIRPYLLWCETAAR
ncbi:hypothetical protein [Sphingomonas sp. OK281]|uniref:hypothetical protein n=1 Tax=Sphingomonas sp. OK281 TaxID=1881067 RepID=UPI000B858E97|nr:hypothetical protein [Sphingomonas sp. OK281]